MIGSICNRTDGKEKKECECAGLQCAAWLDEKGVNRKAGESDDHAGARGVEKGRNDEEEREKKKPLYFPTHDKPAEVLSGRLPGNSALPVTENIVGNFAEKPAEKAEVITYRP